MESALEDQVQLAKEGNKKALDSLIRGIQDRVYGLALRMLGHPADAEDATQEILVKVVTHIGSFRQECEFSTWVYRVAANHLLTIRKRLAENQTLSFEDYESLLEIEFRRCHDQSLRVGVYSLTKGNSASSTSGRCGANLKEEFAIKVVAARVLVIGCR